MKRRHCDYFSHKTFLVIKVFKTLFAPLFSLFSSGTGVATVMITFLLTTYYNVIMTWALFYLFASFQSELPWSRCNMTWNSEDCWSQDDYLNLGPNETQPNGSISSTQEYFE